MSETYLKRGLEPTPLRERKLTVAQREVLEHVKGGRTLFTDATPGFSKRTIKSLVKRGYLQVPRDYGRYVLTEKGREA